MWMPKQVNSAPLFVAVVNRGVFPLLNNLANLLCGGGGLGWWREEGAGSSWHIAPTPAQWI